MKAAELTSKLSPGPISLIIMPSLHSILVTSLYWLLDSENVYAAAIRPRTVLGHDQVVGFPQTVPSTATGSSYLKFQPWLKVRNGCVPFPAVDAAGNTG
jgi:hypothetical protein